jgi:hypothetical protein
MWTRLRDSDGLLFPPIPSSLRLAQRLPSRLAECAICLTAKSCVSIFTAPFCTDAIHMYLTTRRHSAFNSLSPSSLSSTLPFWHYATWVKSSCRRPLLSQPPHWGVPNITDFLGATHPKHPIRIHWNRGRIRHYCCILADLRPILKWCFWPRFSVSCCSALEMTAPGQMFLSMQAYVLVKSAIIVPIAIPSFALRPRRIEWFVAQHIKYTTNAKVEPPG